MNKLIRTVQKVVEDWGIVEIILVVVLFPWSLAYIALRIVQEWGGSDERGA